ncbi:MAG TPA: HAD family phosphatase [Caulobacteraceae bacterium]|nr:HAD family phosphatase [Caulobacteraceae bacterium]
MPALVLDLGGVVYRSWPNNAFHSRWAEQLGCEAEALAERLWGGPEWGPAELGQISPEDCYSAVAGRLGITPELVGEIATEAFASHPDEALADKVMSLRRQGVRTAALTNNIQRAATLIARPELQRLFDVVISSADIRLQKPDPAMFRQVEKQLGQAGSDIVFLDDVIMHVAGAISLGWRGILFQSTDQALADMTTEFARLGIQVAVPDRPN